MKNLFLLLTFCIFFSSCISNKKFLIETGASQIQNELSVLNGVYENTPADYRSPKGGYPLNIMLFNQFHEYNWNEVRDFSGKIILTALSNKKLKADYIVGDSVVKSKILKGKIQKNYFVLKKKIRPLGIPVPPLPFVYKERKSAIGLSKENFLVVLQEGYNYGHFLFFGADNKWFRTCYYNNEYSTNIRRETEKLCQRLAIENPEKTVFYKTEDYSIKSLVWFHNKDSIELFTVTPDGTDKIMLSDNRNILIPDTINTSSNIEVSIDPNTFIGYIRSSEGKEDKKRIPINIMKFSGDYYDNAATFEEDNSLESIIQKDLLFIKDKKGRYFLY